MERGSPLRLFQPAEPAEASSAAGLMFVIGKPVKGGHYGEVPNLSELTEDDNLRHTSDFRRVYATATQAWLGYPETRGLFGEDFEILPLLS